MKPGNFDPDMDERQDAREENLPLHSVHHVSLQPIA